MQDFAETGEWSNWKTIVSIGIDNDPDVIMLEMLMPTIQYEVRAVIREKDNQTISDDLVKISKFATTPCTPLG